MVRQPPFGIADFAFSARLRSALSSWCGSAKVGQSPPPNTVSMLTSAPRVRRSMSSMPVTSLLTSMRPGARAWRREKARSRWVSCPALVAPCRAASVGRFSFSARAAAEPSAAVARTRLMVSILPMMMVRRLLKSWAMPPVSWPTASIFCACRNVSSASRRSFNSCSSSRVRSTSRCMALRMASASRTVRRAAARRAAPTKAPKR